MSNTKSISGPWVSVRHGCVVCTKDSRVVCEINLDNDEEQEAVASLIATTPELYELVLEYRTFLSILNSYSASLGTNLSDGGRIARIDAALAKARGEVKP